ncbi:hypothetical protein OKW33_000263 [Paraburkholderia atlantica]|uniref:immunity 52 family protein n=1 Tax=Paraburkholderia atlantica TaxID=2654982 RepID=UPI002AB03377|nr:immunity 52 family protein [Paraburkholderia atlantica]
MTRSYGKLPALLKPLNARLEQLPNENRAGSTCARTVKSRPFRYAVRDSDELSDIFEISLGEKSDDSSRLGLYNAIAELVSEVALIYEALYVTFGPRAYQDQQVFDNRLGVSWMLYLPHALTPAQVPEARALIPVMREDKQQGTIIVSVTDDVFDVNNRDHVKAANDIEIRLADQDLLPRFVDL